MDVERTLFRTGCEDPLEGGGVVFQEHSGSFLWSFWGALGASEAYAEDGYTIFTSEVPHRNTLPHMYSEENLAQLSDLQNIGVEALLELARSESLHDRVLFLQGMREVIGDLALDAEPETATAEELQERFPFEDLPLY